MKGACTIIIYLSLFSSLITPLSKTKIPGVDTPNPVKKTDIHTFALLCG